ncbi:MAG: hflC [Rickettsiales bacterium]|jgi:membrane protease subunit HflC|nr:hflC [Rickettsiales bacterium]
MKKPLIILPAIALLLAFNSAYIVEQNQKALVLQFGDPVTVNNKPGLHFKMPFLQNIQFFDNRILNLEAREKELNVFEVDTAPLALTPDTKTGKNTEEALAPEAALPPTPIASEESGVVPAETLPFDENERLIRIIVDAYAKYRIVDPLTFYQSVRNEEGLRNRMDAVIESGLKQVLGGVYLTTLLSQDRSTIMGDILEIVSKEAKGFGVEVIDVRVKRVELPMKNREKVYERMRSSKDKEATRLKAEGEEQALVILAHARKERDILLANAEKDAQIIRGEGDADATRIFASAFGKDPKFFNFYRSMQAYRSSLNKDNTSMVLSPESEFLKYLRKLEPNG